MRRVDLAEYELSERLGTGTVGTIFLAKKKRFGWRFRGEVSFSRGQQ